jgi:uncharacterized protein (DUF2267 family)
MATKFFEYLKEDSGRVGQLEHGALLREGVKELTHAGLRRIQQINERHAHINGGTKDAGKILFMAPDPDGGDEYVLSLLTQEQFKSNHMHLLDYYYKFDPKKLVNPADMWLESALKNIILGVGFYPPGVKRPRKFHNEFRGFPYKEIEPSNDDLALYKDGRNPLNQLIYEIPANRVPAKYEYIMDFLAQLFQEPGVLPKVGIGLHSVKQQVGKGFLANMLKELLGPYLIFKNTFEQAFGGNWNEEFERTFMLVINEAYQITHNDKVEAVVKSFITDKWQSIDQRYTDSRQRKHYMRIMALSNKTVFLPADIDSVRWAVFNVNEEYHLNKPHFDKVENWLLDGGFNVWMHEIMHRPYEKRNFQHVPNTEERLLYQLAGMNSVQAFWYERLLEEDLGRYITQFNKNADWHTSIMFAPIGDWQRKHRDYCHDRSDFKGKQIKNVAFSEEFESLIGAPSKGRAGMVLSGSQLDGRDDRVKSMRVYVIPALEQCKILFARRLGRSDYRELGL